MIWRKQFLNSVSDVAVSKINHPYDDKVCLICRHVDKYEQFFSILVIICRLIAATII